jgi:hypothetical protein
MRDAQHQVDEFVKEKREQRAQQRDEKYWQSLSPLMRWFLSVR